MRFEAFFKLPARTNRNGLSVFRNSTTNLLSGTMAKCGSGRAGEVRRGDDESGCSAGESGEAGADLAGFEQVDGGAGEYGGGGELPLGVRDG